MIKNHICLSVCVVVSMRPDLQHSDQQNNGSNGGHHASVVGQQGFAAAAPPHVQFLCVVIVAVVGRVVGHLVLDAGSGRTGVTTAERDSVHQVLAIHVAPDAANRMRQSVILVSGLIGWS